MNIVLLVLYFLATFIVGWVVINKWFRGLPALLTIVGAFILGTAICIPATYFFAVLFARTAEPILWGVIATIGVVAVIGLLIRKSVWRSFSFGPGKKMTLSDMVLVLFSTVFSTWLMTKTFHGGASGELFVGSNNVFDFGLALGNVRSMSWGANIPFMSPYFSGLPSFYHFLFNFWVALWEYLGVPTVWAINIPSILSFSALLIIIYFLPQLLAKQKPVVGWATVFLTITNSSLTFWQLIIQKGVNLQFVKDLWRLPAYPYAGPFDGSTISLYITLNSYVNQRHLAFAVALGLLILLLISSRIQAKRLSMAISIFLGILSGIILLWNIAISALVVISIAFLLLLYKEWKQAFIYLVSAGATAVLTIFPLLPFFYTTYLWLNQKMITDAVSDPQYRPAWNLAGYLWENLGILPLLAGAGFVLIQKKRRISLIPFVALFICLCLIAGSGKRGFDQKFFSYLIIGINMLAAISIGWVWQRAKLIAVALVFIVTISGFVDLMPIKNEFAFPLVPRESLPVIEWIRFSTPKDSVFVSYADMLDPVVFAGRKNYFGFFGNVGWYDRTSNVREIYKGDTTLAEREGVLYVLVPKWEKNDFPYDVHIPDLQAAWQMVYEDDRYIVFAVR